MSSSHMHDHQPAHQISASPFARLSTHFHLILVPEILALFASALNQSSPPTLVALWQAAGTSRTVKFTECSLDYAKSLPHLRQPTLKKCIFSI